MGFDSFSLFAVNAIIVMVMALAFSAAWLGRREAYWKSWSAGNLILAAALILFMFETRLPDPLTVTGPNALLLLGFGLRWRAARQFAGRTAPLYFVFGPAAGFVLLCAVPAIYSSYAAIFTIVNLMLTLQAALIAAEFWRDRKDGLPSRYGLVVSYMCMATSFAVRVGQGAFFGDSMPRHLPHDLLLEIHLLVAVFATAATGAFALSIAYERGAAELRDMAMHDALTGLHNRRAFEQRLRELLRPANPDFALVLLDVDHFKRVNDRFGHAAGDAALRACARSFRSKLRENDFVARIGGEEFAIILRNVSAAEADRITDGIRRAVGGTPVDWKGRRFRVTLSAGIYHSSAGGPGFDEVMRTADELLYQAKKGGRDRVSRSAA